MRTALIIKSMSLLVLLSGAARAADAYINQNSIIPVSTAGWFFAFAVVGFVAVANSGRI
ncbi:hypothetical protein SE916_24750 [Pseudomonas sp. 5FOS]|jgi:hypothetical protein|uniref:EPS-associated small membrane protein EppA n=1 Tax=unclassified Pseudomonas TaxID=196821 RepID=UPI001483A533|nr:MULTISPECIES: hypothetical protein [unclassified Pseudomonas]MCE5995358.1 hypothetical protein [Pseudomonas sp. KCA11]UMY59329.1 hypothetical protein MKK04_13930 [Pseudomonas sp. LS.1a]